MRRVQELGARSRLDYEIHHRRGLSVAPLRANPEVFDCVKGILWQPLVVFLHGVFASVDIKPDNLLLTVVGGLDNCINNASGCLHDVSSDTVAFNDGDNRVIRYDELPVDESNPFTLCWNCLIARIQSLVIPL